MWWGASRVHVVEGRGLEMCSWYIYWQAGSWSSTERLSCFRTKLTFFFQNGSVSSSPVPLCRASRFLLLLIIINVKDLSLNSTRTFLFLLLLLILSVLPKEKRFKKWKHGTKTSKKIICLQKKYTGKINLCREASLIRRSLSWTTNLSQKPRDSCSFHT